MSDIWRCVLGMEITLIVGYIIICFICYWSNDQDMKKAWKFFLSLFVLFIILGILWSAGRFIHKEWKHINQLPITIELSNASISLPTGTYGIGGK